ncbi:hypothetical protein EDB85DRAFT_2179771 [Lactarius pseudohatsudake]|nr:hypothetical protein EDB85DRAFT_2179771 [Lactarius pseudohatsudake]
MDPNFTFPQPSIPARANPPSSEGVAAFYLVVNSAQGPAYHPNGHPNGHPNAPPVPAIHFAPRHSPGYHLEAPDTPYSLSHSGVSGATQTWIPPAPLRNPPLSNGGMNGVEDDSSDEEIYEDDEAFRNAERNAHPENRLWSTQYEIPSWIHTLAGIPGVQLPSEVMWRHVWVGFAVTLKCSASSGFVLRDQNTAVGSVRMARRKGGREHPNCSHAIYSLPNLERTSNFLRKKSESKLRSLSISEAEYEESRVKIWKSAVIRGSGSNRLGDSTDSVQLLVWSTGTVHCATRCHYVVAAGGVHLEQAEQPTPWSASAQDDRGDLTADLRPGHRFQPESLVPTELKSRSTHTGAELSSSLNEDLNGSSDEMPIAPKILFSDRRFNLQAFRIFSAFHVPVISSPLEPHWAVDFSAIREPSRECANSGKRPPCGSLGHMREVFCNSSTQPRGLDEWTPPTPGGPGVTAELSSSEWGMDGNQCRTLTMSLATSAVAHTVLDSIDLAAVQKPGNTITICLARSGPHDHRFLSQLEAL